MNEFRLDTRLENDTYSFIEDEKLILRISKNSLFPWFVIIPKTDKIELFEVDQNLKESINNLVDKLSLFLKKSIGVDKVNVASIGNVVSQLHIHVVGRYFDDKCFPNPVWGCNHFEDYSKEDLKVLIDKLEREFNP